VQRVTSERNRDTAPASGGSFDADGDATRRTHLANERTYLAWWRTGLACMAGSLGVGRVVPALTTGSETLAAVAGVVFGLLGIACFVYGWVRYRQVDAAVRRGEYLRPDDRFVSALAVVGVALALLVLAIVVIDA
jgi:putative membrane protein